MYAGARDCSFSFVLKPKSPILKTLFVQRMFSGFRSARLWVEAYNNNSLTTVDKLFWVNVSNPLSNCQHKKERNEVHRPWESGNWRAIRPGSSSNPLRSSYNAFLANGSRWEGEWEAILPISWWRLEDMYSKIKWALLLALTIPKSFTTEECDKHRRASTSGRRAHSVQLW